MFQYNAVFVLLELKQLHWRGMKKLIHKYMLQIHDDDAVCSHGNSSQ